MIFHSYIKLPERNFKRSHEHYGIWINDMRMEKTNMDVFDQEK